MLLLSTIFSESLRRCLIVGTGGNFRCRCSTLSWKDLQKGTIRENSPLEAGLAASRDPTSSGTKQGAAAQLGIGQHKAGTLPGVVLDEAGVLESSDAGRRVQEEEHKLAGKRFRLGSAAP